MSQTELMLRLIKDRKIVGYVSFRSLYLNNLCGAIWRKSLKGKWAVFDDNDVPTYNSFDLGIKVAKESGDEWWFENDIVELMHDSWDNLDVEKTVYATAMGVLETDQYGWSIKKLNGEDWAFYDPEGRNWYWEKLKRIGSIYGKEGANG